MVNNETINWVYNNESIVVVDCFNYLGLAINVNGKFTKKT